MRTVVIGEGMLELRCQGENWQLGSGGDTLNTAIHLARYGLDVAFLTALGKSDPFSDKLQDSWEREGVDPSLIVRVPQRNPGLYAITTDERGERSFSYWRENSAARAMFDQPDIDALFEKARDADLIVYSLISLAILPEKARQSLWALCRDVRKRGGRVAFDSNYRPALWASAEEAAAARDIAIQFADIGLPTLADEMALSQVRTASEVLHLWQKKGCSETIVKLGAEGCLLPDGNVVAPPKQLKPIDTSGAGDAFNGGYLAARLHGATIRDSVVIAQRLASWVIMQPGAIPAQSDKALYELALGERTP